MPDLSTKAFAVIISPSDAKALVHFLDTLGDAGLMPDESRLLKLVNAGIAQFGDRAVRDMEAGAEIAAARLMPWTMALSDLPEWAILGAFTRCNQAAHPPRPVEVKEAAQNAAGGLAWFI